MKMRSFNKTLDVVLNYIVVLVIKFLKTCINSPITYICSFKKSERCPPMKNNILYISARELAQKIRVGELTSKEVILAYIERIQEVNCIVNAVIEDRYSQALEDATKVDELVASKQYSEDELEEKFPLLGVPVTVKCSIAVKDMVLVGGRYFRDMEKRRSKKDADIVRQVKEAGAIVVLISSCPELCKNLECFNKIIGRTKNPYDTRRTSGGSSGGEAALLSSGASIIGLGSDMAGSCRLPAAFCGIFGHKPSAKSISIEGHYPDSGDRERWTSNFALGPMVRYAEDLPLLMSIICKSEHTHVLKLDHNVDLTKIKIFYRLDDGNNNLTQEVHTDISDGIIRIVKHFKETVGCTTEEAHIQNLNHSTGIAFTKLICMNDVDDVFDKQPKGVYTEMVKKLCFMSDHAMASLMYIAGKRLFNQFVTEKQLKLCERGFSNLKSAFCEILGDEGVFLYPTTVGPAFFPGQVYGNFFDCTYTAIFNVLGFPATNCPIGLTADGLPIGVQIIANMNCDRLTFAIAQEIQNTFGGWQPPPFAH